MFIKAGTCKRFVADKANKVFRMPHLTQGSDTPSKDWLVTTSANISQQLVVILDTIKQSIELSAIASLEFASTLLTTVMFCVHSLSPQDDVLSDDRLLALATRFSYWCYSLSASIFAHIAINIAFFFFVGLPYQVLSTSGTCEVMRVIFAISNCHTFVCYRLLTVYTSRTEQFSKVFFAIEITLVLYKGTIGKG